MQRQLLTRGGPMRIRTLSFFGVNSHSFHTEKKETVRIHILGPRIGLFDGTPHELTKNTLNFLLHSCWSLWVEMPDVERIWRVLEYGTF